MNTQELQLVNFEQAKRLKKAGFDWNPYGIWYREDGGMTGCMQRQYCDSDIPAPTVAISMKWFRDVKGLDSEVLRRRSASDAGRASDDREFVGNIFNLYGTWLGGTDGYDTYEATESALLDELLKIIEENNQ